MPSSQLCLSNGQHSARTPKLAPYQIFHIWKSIDGSTKLPFNNTAGQESLSAALHCSRFCYNYDLPEMQDEQRREPEKSESHEYRKKKVSWMDQVTSGIQILQNFTSVSFLECTQIKLIAFLLVGMLITHVNLPQSITILSGLFLCLCTMPENSPAKFLMISAQRHQGYNSEIQSHKPVNSFMFCPTTTHGGVLKRTSYIKKTGV